MKKKMTLVDMVGTITEEEALIIWHYRGETHDGSSCPPCLTEFQHQHRMALRVTVFEAMKVIKEAIEY